MTHHLQATTAIPDTEFDLDLRIVSSGPVIADLMRNTDDNCGQTCQSACSNSTCG